MISKLIDVQKLPWLHITGSVRCSIQMVNRQWKSKGSKERQDSKKNFEHFWNVLSVGSEKMSRHLRSKQTVCEHLAMTSIVPCQTNSL